MNKIIKLNCRTLKTFLMKIKSKCETSPNTLVGHKKHFVLHFFKPVANLEALLMQID